MTSIHLYLISELGFRFSGGRVNNGVNKEGVDYYNNLINELILHGITPYVTLFHWDTPNCLEKEYMGFLDKKIM